jgi:hypothetical protein
MNRDYADWIAVMALIAALTMLFIYLIGSYTEPA